MHSEFVIYSAQRSGSSYLMRALDDHPQVICAGTIFRRSKSVRAKYPDLNFDYAAKSKTKWFKWFPTVVVRKHLNKVFSFKDANARGFRLMVNQAKNIPSVLKLCKKKDVKLIVIIRENIVRQAISLTIAQNAGLWQEPEVGVSDFKRIELDIQRFNKNIGYFQKSRTELENVKWGSNPLVIHYDELLHHPKETVQKVYRFLGVLPEYETKLKGLKRSHFKLEDRIVNFKEVLSEIKKHGLEAFITED